MGATPIKRMKRNQHVDAYSVWTVRANDLEMVQVTLPRGEWKLLIGKMRAEAVDSPTYDRCSSWVRLCEQIQEQVR